MPPAAEHWFKKPNKDTEFYKAADVSKPWSENHQKKSCLVKGAANDAANDSATYNKAQIFHFNPFHGDKTRTSVPVFQRM